MKNKWISLAAAGILLLLAACNNEDDPVASEDLGIVDMFSPGADADQEVKDIYNKYGVWVRTHFDDIDELANAIIAEDQMVSMRGATNIQEQYIPGEGTESLYAVINETNAGTQEDPIPYAGNMALENGTYYSQDGVIYLCNRDTEIPVYQALKDLVGLYVTVAE